MKTTTFYGLVAPLLTLCTVGCQPGSKQATETASHATKTPTPAEVRPTPDSSLEAADTLQIIFPKGGETLTKGQTYRFKWTGGSDSTLSIFLVDSALESKGASVSLTDRLYGIQNKGSYDYSFPQRVTAGTYKVQIGKKFSGYFRVIKADTASDK